MYNVQRYILKMYRIASYISFYRIPSYISFGSRNPSLRQMMMMLIMENERDKSKNYHDSRFFLFMPTLLKQRMS